MSSFSISALPNETLAFSKFDSCVNVIEGDVLNIEVNGYLRFTFVPHRAMYVYGVWFYRSESGRLYATFEEGPGMGVYHGDGFLYPVPELFLPDEAPRIHQVRESDEVLQLYAMAGLPGFPFRSPGWSPDGNSGNG